MSTLHVLLPSLAHAREDLALRSWLARGDRLPDIVDARDSLLRELFRFAGDAIPVAALRHSVHADDAGTGAWLTADPAHVRSEATGARLMAWPIEDLTADEAAQLATAVRPLFGDAGTPLAIDTATAWCLHLPGGAPPVEFVRPADAMGVDLLECLPRGDAGRAWRHLFNEAQIALHAHPVNAARVAAGKLPVNALWLWGAGALPGGVTTSLVRVASDDDVVHGLARVARVTCVEPSVSTLDAAGRAGDALLDLKASWQTGTAVQWLPHFRHCLRQRRFDTVALVFASGERFRVRHSHRLRFWRRS